jgi:serine/threonine protein kinase
MCAVSLDAGSRLGPYGIVNSLGAGGMGEVYRARDTRLDRDVAITILPESVAHDADRRSRFEREAKAVAALTPPNILAIHDVGESGGVAYAVTELLDGETRTGRGPLFRRSRSAFGGPLARSDRLIGRPGARCS